ncbi:zinc finger protein 2 homolog isoform X1 [Cheilinus undulatus]|uniref:zinc finger protein 2 homolog isoform X1 n=1 Tax=Cheilinus undulatus TaxID=241271 RepID=UPI001BD30B5E|nr:zinc finger protein 2 homolog isoform X1 [Cheilinus undulatus]
MPKFCAVFGCSNRSNREKNKSFFRVPKVVTHRSEKYKQLTEKRRQTWIRNLRLKSRGAESVNARVCSDHFVKGCPSAVYDEEDEDWAPTVRLGYNRETTVTEASGKREERSGVRRKTPLDPGEDSQSPLPVTVFPADVQQLLVCKEEPPEEQEWSPGLDQEDMKPQHIKEEQEELWSSQKGEQLEGHEETDIIKFRFSPAPVKSEDDEEKPQFSQLHQIQIGQMETGADGEDCGGSDQARNSDPERHLQSEIEVTIEGSSDPETDDSDEWKETREHQSGLNSEESIKHKKPKTDKKSHSCPECGKLFKFKSSLTAHMVNHRGEQLFSCSECGQRFNRKAHLTQHMRIHTGEKPFSCSECGKNFNQKGNLTTHMLVHSGQKPFCCVVCGKRFTQQGSLIKHMAVHTKEKPFGCSECGKIFSLKGQLTQHMRSHTGEKPFSCSECGKRFTQQGSMNRHMKIHSGEKPFCCSECNKKFKQKLYLTLHMAHHRGEKPLHCSVCDQRFSWHSTLRNHKCLSSKPLELNGNHAEENMEAQSGAEQEDCEGFDHAGISDPDRNLQPTTDVKPEHSVDDWTESKKENIEDNRLDNDSKSHRCPDCGKNFNQEGHLIDHMRTHTGEKPFICPECGERFTQQDCMTKHMRIHSEEKPFGCSECGKRFGIKTKLIQHMRGHTEETPS